MLSSAGDVLTRIRPAVAQHFPNLFSQVAVGLLQAGEGSGSLDESFRSIRVLVVRSENIRHQTIMMILQPAITLLMAVLSIGIMVVYIVPQFRSLLEYLGGKLPWQTELMMSISDYGFGLRLIFNADSEGYSAKIPQSLPRIAIVRISPNPRGPRSAC